MYKQGQGEAEGEQDRWVAGSDFRQGTVGAEDQEINLAEHAHHLQPGEITTTEVKTSVVPSPAKFTHQ